MNMWRSTENIPTTIGAYHEEFGVLLRIRGVSHSDFLDTREGLVTLLSGRTFTDDDLSKLHDIHPVMVAEGFATNNHLIPGSIFSVQIVEHDEYFQWLSEVAYEFEVIGIFEPTFTEIDESAEIGSQFVTSMHQMMMQQRIYVSNLTAEMLIQERDKDFMNETDEPFIQSFFVLKDSRYIDDFRTVVSNISPHFNVVDLSTGISPLTSTLDSLHAVATFTVMLAIASATIILVLIVLMQARERRNEVGIYLALGESRGRVVQMFVYEILPVIFIALLISSFFANMLAQSVSDYFLQQQLFIGLQDVQQQWNPLNELGYRFDLNYPELRAAFVLENNLFFFAIFTLSTLILSALLTAIPTYLLTKRVAVSLIKDYH